MSTESNLKPRLISYDYRVFTQPSAEQPTRTICEGTNHLAISEDAVHNHARFEAFLLTQGGSAAFTREEVENADIQVRPFLR